LIEFAGAGLTMFDSKDPATAVRERESREQRAARLTERAASGARFGAAIGAAITLLELSVARSSFTSPGFSVREIPFYLMVLLINAVIGADLGAALAPALGPLRRQPRASTRGSKRLTYVFVCSALGAVLAAAGSLKFADEGELKASFNEHGLPMGLALVVTTPMVCGGVAGIPTGLALATLRRFHGKRSTGQ
jgi:hypothetical protein